MSMRTGFFDLGGVLIHYDPMLIVRRLCREFNHLKAEETADLLFQSQFIRAYETGRISTDAFHRGIQNDLRISIPFTRFKRYWQDIFTPNTPVIHLVESLENRLQLVAISNTNPLHIEFITERYAFINRFRHAVYSYETGYCKPDKHIFLEAMARSRSSPETSFFVDDKAENVRAAEELGIRSILFTGSDDLATKIKDIDC